MSDDEADFEVDPSLAASLGFSSFGAQPSTKRRKYFHNDAYVAAPAKAAQRVTKSASGGNAVPVGERRGIEESRVGRADESGDGGLVLLPRAMAEQRGAQASSKASLTAAPPSEGPRRGDADATAYFLPSFVEDPWAKLMAERG